MKSNSVGLFLALSTSAMIATSNSAIADLVNPTYSGDFIVAAGGDICAGGFCFSQQSASHQVIAGPGTLSYSGSAPLISDGTGSVPPSNYTPGATASGSFSFSQNPSPSMTMFGTASTVPVNEATAGATIANATLTYSMEITGPTPRLQCRSTPTAA